jgi:hypothetical protein
MAEAGNVDQLTFLEDRHMWRLLLAKVHPDAGGDHELFLFACAVKEGIYDRRRSGRKSVIKDGRWSTEHLGEHFPRGWREAMSGWASRNREALRNGRI